jgi:hypothetical protein
MELYLDHDFAMAIDVNGYNLLLPLIGKPQTVSMPTRRFAERETGQ